MSKLGFCSVITEGARSPVREKSWLTQSLLTFTINNECYRTSRILVSLVFPVESKECVVFLLTCLIKLVISICN